jgi:hypothetical protein
MLSLQDVIAKNSAPSQPPQNSSQLLVNRFSYRYDADIRDYAELTMLRVISGGLHPAPTVK